MAADVVGRGAVWASFILLYRAVKETQEKDLNIKRSLEKINRTLEALKPVLEEIDELNDKVVADLPPDQILGFKSEMEKGAELVMECSKSKEAHGFHLFKKSTDYKEKLQELDESLHRFIRILEVQGVRDAKETSIMLREIYDAIMNKQTNLGFGGDTSNTPSSYHQSPSLVAGLHDDTVKKQTKSTAGDWIAGGGVGQAFNILCEVAKDTKMKNIEFKPTLEKINATLEALKPLLEDREKLDLPESEISGFKTEMEEGAELIRKCSEVHGYNIFKKSSYKDKLEELNGTLRNFIQKLQARRA